MQSAATAELVPPIAKAGEIGQWVLRYWVGHPGMSAGDILSIETDSDTDWEEPQTVDEGRPGFVQLTVSGETAANADTAPDRTATTVAEAIAAAVYVISARRMEVRLVAGELEPGREIQLVFGAGRGSRMQTFAENRRYFHVRHITPGDKNSKSVTAQVSPFLRVVGNTASRLVLLAPTSVILGEEVRLVLKAEDDWGNPASDFVEDVRVSLGDAQWTGKLSGDRAVTHVTLPVPAVEPTAIVRATAVCSSFSARSNPIVVFASAEELPERQFWGDFHGGQLVDVEKIADYYRYAHEISGLQFSSYQRNDHEMTDDQWETQKTIEKQFYRPGEFIALPGYEWSADTNLGGDRNVLFPRHGLPLLRSSSSAVPGADPDPARELPNQEALYRHYRYSDVVLVPHVGGRQSDIRSHDSQLEPIVEIASTHGTFEWFYREALRRGYKVGVVAGSDGYTGRPGSEHPGFITRRFSRSGSAAIRTKDLTLHGILEAVRARRTYATSGPRIYLDVRAGDAGMGAEMGEEVYTNAPIPLKVRVCGECPIERVDLYRRDSLIQTFRPEGGRFADRWRVVMTGAASWQCYSGVRWIGCLQLAGATIQGLVPLRFDSPRSAFLEAKPGETVKAGESLLRWDTTNCGYAHGFEFTAVRASDEDTEDRGKTARGTGGDVAFQLAVETHLHNRMYSGAEVPGTMRVSSAPGERASLSGLIPAASSVTRADAPHQRYSLYLGPAEREIRLEPVWENESEEVTVTFVDETPQPGLNAYWIRVTQRDLHVAWSSPIFVHYEPQPL